MSGILRYLRGTFKRQLAARFEQPRTKGEYLKRKAAVLFYCLPGQRYELGHVSLA